LRASAGFEQDPHAKAFVRSLPGVIDALIADLGRCCASPPS
jgi:hypothetical protein